MFRVLQRVMVENIGEGFVVEQTSDEVKVWLDGRAYPKWYLKSSVKPLD